MLTRQFFIMMVIRKKGSIIGLILKESFNEGGFFAGERGRGAEMVKSDHRDQILWKCRVLRYCFSMI